MAMSLLVRLLIVSVALVAIGLVAADVAAYATLQSYLMGRAESDLTASTAPVNKILGTPGTAPDGTANALAILRLVDVSYTVFDPGGRLVTQTKAVRLGKQDLAPPSLPDIGTLPVTPLDALEPSKIRSVIIPAVGGGFDYAVAAIRSSAGTTVVVGLPLIDVETTLDKLRQIEIVVTLVVIGLMALVGTWLVRIGLRPLSRMERTAAEIAAGDLTGRVEPADGRSEVGRLGQALNTMLGTIEDAFEARSASEARLRRLVTDASHELRTPLTSIRGYAELFRRGADRRPDDLRRAMRGIETEAERMAVLVDELLLLARLDEGQPLPVEAVDIVAVAREAVDAARAVEPDRPIELRTPTAALVQADRDRIRQVVDNLLANVRVHTPKRSPATVTVEVDDDIVRLEVADTGPGLTDDERAHVFDRFYRVDASRSRDTGGSGLGLAIVAAIVSGFAGVVTVDSTPEGGARFRVELPLFVA
jgi:two-component system OmpR family sensor kinase